MTLDQFTTQASDYAVRGRSSVLAARRRSPGSSSCLVTGLIVIFFARYYRGSPMPRGEVPERESHEIEIGWTVATLFLFLFIFWWAASDQLTALTPPKNALEIHVVAKQWMWRIQHPSGAREIDELHVPADTKVRLAMTSRGRDPRSLSAGAAAQAGYPAGPLYLSVVQRQQDRHLPSDLRRILRHRPFGDVGPLGDRDAGRIMRAGPRRSRKATISPIRAKLCSARSAARDATRRARPCTRPICTASTAIWSSSPTAAPSSPTKPICAIRSCCRTRTSLPALRRSCRAFPAWRARTRSSSSWPI